MLFDIYWVCLELGSFFAKKAAWDSACFAVICAFSWKKNARIFRNHARTRFLLWDKILFVASLWLRANNYFRWLVLFNLHRNWAAALS